MGGGNGGERRGRGAPKGAPPRIRSDIKSGLARRPSDRELIVKVVSVRGRIASNEEQKNIRDGRKKKDDGYIDLPKVQPSS